jgi:RNA recognition motif-containing protein
MGPKDKRRREESPKGADSSDTDKVNLHKMAKTEVSKDEDPKARTIIVSQLTSKVKETHLRDFFGQIDEVKDVAMPRNDHGKHKGVAYVEFRRSENISSCMLLNDTVPDFQKFPILVDALIPQTPVPPPQAPPPPLSAPVSPPLSEGEVPTKALLTNIPLAVLDGELRSVLTYYGTVSELRVSESQGNKMAYVTFANETAARNAREALHKFELCAGQKLDVSLVKNRADTSGLGREVTLSNLPLGEEAAVEADVKNECLKANLGEVAFEKLCEKAHSADFVLRCQSVSDALRAEKTIDGRFYRGRLVSAQVEPSK